MLKEASSSTSSFTNAKICRICHIVERGTMSTTSLNVKGKPKNDFLSNLVTLVSKALIGIDFQKHSAGDDEMIVPCQCKGTMQFVHRGCLNQWRAVSGRNDSFQRCEQCFAPYKFNEGILSWLITSRLFLLCVTALIFWSWILLSMLVTTSTEAGMFNLLPKITLEYDSYHINVFQIFFKIHPNSSFYENVMDVIINFNDLMDRCSRLFYGLIFIAVTEYIFLSPSFLLSFNILFCVWRIQKYEIFCDKCLLAGLTIFGVFRAWRSINTGIENLIHRATKLWFLKVQNQEEELQFNKED